MANLSFLKQHKQKVDIFLKEYLGEQGINFKEHPQARALFPYLADFCQNGKGIRGSIFLEILRLLKLQPGEIKNYLPAAAAFELIHSALLIQDDWMDHDDVRRGKIALHSKLREEGKKEKLNDHTEYSGFATNCAVDIAFFLGFELLNKVKNPSFFASREFVLKEYSHVGFAQWQDVYFSYQEKYSLSDVERIYRYKTARYTFVMPVLAALVACKYPQKEIKIIENATLNLGMIFQITDDRLNIFGNTDLTKKAVGSDISDNKKTFYHFFFHKILKENPKQKELLIVKSFFGKKEISEKEMLIVKNTFEKFAVTKSVDNILAKYQKECNKQISQIKNKNIQEVLSILLEYLLERKS